jgi:hypothetical protein
MPLPLLEIMLTLLRCRSSLMRLLLLMEGHTRETFASSLWIRLSRLNGSCKQHQRHQQL